ncbi:MAG TPA: hypothetical protein VHE30_22765 [Polyangiaceae bacterium]|nr:hypothetical protein [Polyangiaceae bacterium]
MRAHHARRTPLASLGQDILALFSPIALSLFTSSVAFAQENQETPPAADAPAASPAPAQDESGPKADEAAPPPPAPAEAAAADAPPAAEPAKPKPPPYSLPFQLRPAAAATAVRLDTSMGFYKDPVTGNSASTVVPILLASYKVTKELAPLVRVGFVQNSPPDPPAGAAKTDSSFGLLNPLLGATYAIQPSKETKLAFFLGVTLPIGSGGGDSPDKAAKVARSVGLNTRSAFDNALFAVNDLTVIPGVDFAYVAGGFTAQVEATLFQLTRVRGSADQKDSSKTNFTTGLHLGYFLVPELSIGAEIRHQRWLSTPDAVKNDKTGSLRDTTTVAFGPRLHFQIGEGKWFRPGVSLSLPLDDPMKKASYKVVQLDLPFSF